MRILQQDIARTVIEHLAYWDQQAQGMDVGHA